ncbi:MAG: hypothetical protein HKN47_25515 [Pirellulaceae bacterium]|nr:hypothetical protein [Pirellulaceae bacterium]
MFALLLSALLMHPVHETVSEIEWNPQSGRLEVAVRLSVLDEQWIQQRHATNREPVNKWAIRYLQSRFRVDPSANVKLAESPANASSVAEVPPTNTAQARRHAVYHWIGREEEGSHVWWYFEIETAKKAKPAVVEQRMLFEREDKYANRVLILGKTESKVSKATVSRRAVTLTIDQPTARLDAPASKARNDAKKLQRQ